MSERIEASDILGEDATARIKEFNDSIRETAVFAKQLEKVVQSIGKNPLNNSSNIAQHNKDMAESIKLENSLNAAKLKSEKIALDALKQEEKLQNAVKKAQEENIKNTNRQTKEQSNLTSEYRQATEALNRMAKRQMDNVLAGREMSKTAKLVADSHAQLKVQVEKAEASVGRFQRNVGNYKSGFNGLSNSVNQLTREMPAFANSVQTGFMAISNNLPIFFDEIQKANRELKALKAQGEQVPSLFKTIASSIFTFGTLLSVGVTLLTVYGKEMVNFVIDMAKGDEAFRLSGERQSTYYKALKAHNDEAFESRLRIMVLNKEMTAKEADEWREDSSLKIKKIQAEIDHNERLKEIATSFRVEQDKLTGKLPEITPEYLPGKDPVSGKLIYYKAVNRSIYKDNILINKAALEEDRKYKTELELIEKSHRLKLDEIKAGKDPKEKKDKAFKLTDQDKRILDEMEVRDEKIMKAKENLKKWTEESEADQLKNTQQNIKTESDFVIEAHNVDVDNIEKLQKIKEAKDKQRRKEELQATVDWFEAIGKAKNDLLEKQLNNDLDMRQRNILQQQQLAIAGRDNTLAFEKAAAAKDELSKIELAKKEEKRAKGLAFLKLVSAYADKGDADGAVTKSLIQMAIAGAIVGSYEEGTEDTGNGGDADNKRGRFVIVHPNERIVTKEQNKKIGDISNEELANIAKMHNEGLLPKYMTDNNTGSFAENLTNSLLLKQFNVMNAEIKDIKQALKDRPVNQTHYNKDTDEIIDKRITNGFIQQSRQKSSSKLNYI